mgnify:CR=1 FL=1
MFFIRAFPRFRGAALLQVTLSLQPPRAKPCGGRFAPSVSLTQEVSEIQLYGEKSYTINFNFVPSLKIYFFASSVNFEID